MSNTQHSFKLISNLLNFSESEVPSQERKNFKSSPEIQVGNLKVLKLRRLLRDFFPHFK